MKRLLTLTGLAALAVSAFAYSTFCKVLSETYKIDPDSNLGKAKCATCHVSAKGGKLNPFGKDLQVVLKEAKSKKLTAEYLAKVEALDSDKDGLKNGVELKSDKNPGVPN